MKEKTLIQIGIGLIFIVGIYFISASQSGSPEKSILALKQAFADNDTVMSEKLIDSKSIGDNLWPRYKILYQQNIDANVDAGAEQEKIGKDAIEQSFYQAERGNENEIFLLLSKLFTLKSEFKINGDIASTKVSYDNENGVYPITFIFKKFEKDWKIVDIQGLENVMLYSVLPESTVDLFKQVRDSQRLSDLGSLKGAITLYQTTVDNVVLCADQNKIYRSDQGTDDVDGTGWLPVNFTSTTGGSPLPKLPTDPINRESFIYFYACDPANQVFELNASMESKRYKKSGIDDIASTDKGDNSDFYETGTSLRLIH